MKDNCIIIFLLVTILLVCYMSSRENYEDPSHKSQSLYLDGLTGTYSDQYIDIVQSNRVDALSAHNNSKIAMVKGKPTGTNVNTHDGKVWVGNGADVVNKVDAEGQIIALHSTEWGGIQGYGYVISSGMDSNLMNQEDEHNWLADGEAYSWANTRATCKGTGACAVYKDKHRKGGKQIMRGGADAHETGNFHSVQTDNAIATAHEAHHLASRTGKMTKMSSVMLMFGAGGVALDSDGLIKTTGGTTPKTGGEGDRWDVYFNPGGSFMVTPEGDDTKVWAVTPEANSYISLKKKSDVDKDDYLFSMGIDDTSADGVDGAWKSKEWEDFKTIHLHQASSDFKSYIRPRVDYWKYTDNSYLYLDTTWNNDSTHYHFLFVNPQSHGVVGGSRNTAITATPSYSILSQMGGAFGDVMSNTSTEDCQTSCTDDSRCSGFVSGAGDTCALNTNSDGGSNKLTSNVGSTYYMKSDSYSGFVSMFGSIAEASGQKIVKPEQSPTYCAGTCNSDPKCVAFSLSKTNVCSQLMSDTPGNVTMGEIVPGATDVKMSYRKVAPGAPDGCNNVLMSHYGASAFIPYTNFKNQCENGDGTDCPRLPALACDLDEYASISYDKKTSTKSTADAVGEAMIISVDNCKIKCDAEETCEGFNYTKSEGKCSMTVGYSDSTAESDTSNDFYLKSRRS